MIRFVKYTVPTALALTLCILQGLSVSAQNPTYAFKSSVSADSILIGDQVELTIEASVPQSYKVQFPIFADTLVAGIEVLGQPRLDTITKKTGDKDFVYRMRITSFDEGYYRIPPFRLPFTDGVTQDTAQTSPIWFLVNTLPPDSTVATIYDIKHPLAEPYTFAEVAPWVGGGLLLAALIALLIYIVLKRRKGEPVFFNLKPAEPPHIVALRELEQIKSQKLWSTQDPKQFQSHLTDVVRTYIEGRFAVPAMEQTTFETIQNLQKAKLLEGRLLEKLQDILALADLTKFAKFTPDASENLASLEFGFAFVNETKIVEEETAVRNDLPIDAIANEDTLPVESTKTNDK